MYTWLNITYLVYIYHQLFHTHYCQSGPGYNDRHLSQVLDQKDMQRWCPHRPKPANQYHKEQTGQHVNLCGKDTCFPLNTTYISQVWRKIGIFFHTIGVYVIFNRNLLYNIFIYPFASLKVWRHIRNIYICPVFRCILNVLEVPYVTTLIQIRSLRLAIILLKFMLNVLF